jgi:succinyl-CoA synthetase beta subunit/citryl-CoA synthetase large subunit
MRLLEFEAKNILSKHKIPVPKSVLLNSPAPLDIDYPVFLKVQIPLGGRGKAGGVVSAANQDEARKQISGLLNQYIRGYKPYFILAEEMAAVEQEYFMAVTYDTVAKLPLLIFSPAGGVAVEDLSASQPDKIRKRHFSARNGLMQHQARELIAETGISGKILLKLTAILTTLAEIFLKYDCTIIEINPLALCKDGNLTALDCHADIEDDALFRHPDLAALDKDETRFVAENKKSEFERLAAEIDQVDHRGVAGRVIEFDGNLGLIIGGGGASLTAFDAVRQHGGRPANYCEIGGNPSVRKVQALTRHILSKPGVDKVSVIMNVVSNTRVDLISRGIIKGVLAAGKKPSEAIAVFRVPGAWEEEGFKILKKYDVPHCDRTVSIDKAAKIAVRKFES